MTKRSFTGKCLRAKTHLKLIHSDLCGPMNVKARGGYEYFISFIDDYSRYGHIYLIQNKSDSFEKFKEYKADVENESGKTIKTLRSDQGGKYMDLQFQDYLIEHGIQSQLSAPSMPQQNGVSERRNQTLLDMVHSIMSFSQLPYSFWGYTLETAIYILNNVPSKSVSETPYELWKVCKGLSEVQIVIPDNGIEDPLTYKQAMSDVDCDQWVKAMDLEMESMYSNSVWTLVDQPNDVKPIGCHLTDIKKWLAMQFQMKDLENAQYVLDLTFAIHQGWLVDISLILDVIIGQPLKIVYMLVYSIKDLILTGYIDSDFRSDKDARKSTSGSVFTLNGGAVVW
ncbi:gag/pol protein [Cucumis melo var. makuwa]|uniref:Gag/pol protein n=1 Tax=Cucumis melo var. makuwa TaxID=1194695 RepID=A0A5A7UC33_CUCMM|nr:gag/pol protein [Cucumis melo var. makuwa]